MTRISASSDGRRPRLLTVLPAGAIGGAETFTAALLARLSGFELTLLAQAVVAPLFAGLPVALHLFEDHGLASPADYRPRNALAYARAIADTARRSDADVVFGVMHQASLFIALARWRHPRAMAGRALVGSVHGSMAGYFAHRGAGPSRYERMMMRLVFGTLDAVTVPSRGVAEELTQTYGAPAPRVHAIHNGFDLQAIRERAMAPLPPGEELPWVVTCCRLNAQKDFETLLQAFAGLSTPARLVIVGDGELRPAIEARIHALGLEERVLLAGHQANPFPWMARADVFVLSSFFEGFGNVLVEAMALGVPVVASDCPSGPGEIIEHGVNGFLFAVGDRHGLRDRLQQLLQDPELCARTGGQARLRAEKFSQARMVSEYRTQFVSAMHARGRP